MAVTATPIYLQGIGNYFAVLVDTSDTFLTSAGANGSKIDAIYMSNAESFNYDAVLKIYNGTTMATMGTMVIPANSGYNGLVPLVNLLKTTQINFPRDENGNPFIHLANGYSIYITALTSPSSTSSLICIQRNF